MHLKTNDIVQVIAGNAKGQRGKVLHIDHDAGKVTVETVNKVWRHVRKSQKNPQGGRLNKEMPIQISNVLLVCSRCNQPTRTGARVNADGSKERFCRRKTCHATLGQIAPSKKRK